MDTILLIHNNIAKRYTNGMFPWCSLGPGVAAAAPGCPSCTCRRSPASAAAAWSRTCSCRGLTWNVTGRHDQIWHDRKLIFESSLVVIVNSYSRMLFALQEYGSRTWLETSRATLSNSYVRKQNNLNKSFLCMCALSIISSHSDTAWINFLKYLSHT